MALEFASRDCLRYEQVLLLCRGTSEHADAPGRDLVDGNWIELERTDFGCRIVGEAQNSLLHLIIFSLNYGLGPFLLKLWGEPVTVSASLTVWSNKQGEVGNWWKLGRGGKQNGGMWIRLWWFDSCNVCVVFFRLCLCLLWQCFKSFSLFFRSCCCSTSSKISKFPVSTTPNLNATSQSDLGARMLSWRSSCIVMRWMPKLTYRNVRVINPESSTGMMLRAMMFWCIHLLSNGCGVWRCYFFDSFSWLWWFRNSAQT